MDIKEALTFDGLKYFYTKYIKPLKTGAYATVVNNATTTVTNTVLDGRMGKTLSDKDTELQKKIENLATNTRKITVASKLNFDITNAPGGVIVTVNYNVPTQPLAIIPIVHSAIPVACSVNQWSTTSAEIALQAMQPVYNKNLQVIIIY